MPLRGGAKLEADLSGMARRIKTANSVRVGFLENTTYPDGTSLPMVAAIQEYGAPRVGIPPRPYFRTMIKQQGPGWGGILTKILAAEDLDAEKALGRMGEVIKAQLYQSISSLQSPPLSEVTLMLRMMKKKDSALVVTGRTVAEARRRVAAGERASGVSTKPLIDTGWLIQHIGVEVNT